MEELTFAPLLPASALAAAAGFLALLALIVAWRARLRAPAWMNAGALLLRWLALGCAVVLIARPEVLRRQTRAVRRPLIILVDDTQSLRLRDGERAPTRAEQGAAALSVLLSAAAAHDWAVRAYDAGDRLLPRQPQDSGLRAAAASSPLGERLAESLANRRLRAPQEEAGSQAGAVAGAVVLISDGCVNRGRPLAEAAGLLADRGVPLYAVALGEQRPLPPDAALTGLVVRPAATSGAAVPAATEGALPGQRLSVEARGQLLPGGPALSGPLADTMARLSVAGPLGAEASDFAEVDSFRHRLREAPAFTPARLAFTPRTPGLYRLRLSLDGLVGERQLANNVAYGSAQVFPPRRRVVYVCSRLGHDYRHLKQLFAAWAGPAVEVVNDFVRTAPAAEGAPAENPSEGLLGRWLEEGALTPSRGGVLIWEEPDPGRISGRTQAKLRAAVQSGELGVIWVVNEPAGALAARLRGTPLEDLFLFRDLASPEQEPAHAELGAEGAAREHPATRWAFAEARGRDPFAQALAPLAACGGFAAPRDGTVVLLRSAGRPLLSVGEVGAGRVALLASGETWRWLAPLRVELGREDSPRLATELWRRLVEWAGGETDAHEPIVRIHLARDIWELGQPLRARVAVRLPDPGAEVKLEHDMVRLASGQAVPAPRWAPFSGAAAGEAWDQAASGEGKGARLRVFSGAAGTPDQEGEWLLRVRALTGSGALIGTDQAPFCVQGSALEERSVRPDHQALAAAVEAARRPGRPPGRVLKPDPAELGGLVEDLEDVLRPQGVLHVTRGPAVSTAGLFGLLILALLVDIWLRRG